MSELEYLKTQPDDRYGDRIQTSDNSATTFDSSRAQFDKSEVHTDSHIAYKELSQTKSENWNNKLLFDKSIKTTSNLETETEICDAAAHHRTRRSRSNSRNINTNNQLNEVTSHKMKRSLPEGSSEKEPQNNLLVLDNSAHINEFNAYENPKRDLTADKKNNRMKKKKNGLWLFIKKKKQRNDKYIYKPSVSPSAPDETQINSMGT